VERPGIRPPNEDLYYSTLKNEFAPHRKQCASFRKTNRHSAFGVRIVGKT